MKASKKSKGKKIKRKHRRSTREITSSEGSDSNDGSVVFSETDFDNTESSSEGPSDYSMFDPIKKHFSS